MPFKRAGSVRQNSASQSLYARERWRTSAAVLRSNYAIRRGASLPRIALRQNPKSQGARFARDNPATLHTRKEASVWRSQSAGYGAVLRRDEEPHLARPRRPPNPRRRSPLRPEPGSAPRRLQHREGSPPARTEEDAARPPEAGSLPRFGTARGATAEELAGCGPSYSTIFGADIRDRGRHPTHFERGASTPAWRVAAGHVPSGAPAGLARVVRLFHRHA